MKIIGVSEAVRRELPASEKNMVIYNELPEYSVEFSPGVSKLIVFPANYITGKGQNYAIEAFAKIADKFQEWTLRFVGGDMGLSKNKAYKSSLIKRSQELGLSNRIEFLDFATNLVLHYQEAAFILNFSDSESFSLTTLEAQFNGRPVVVTRCGGPEEIIIDGETGILVPLKDIDAMAQAMELLMTKNELRQKMGAKAYSHVREKFSHQNTSGKLADVYLSAIKK
ncbi:glycosyltransferase family 4 protein [Chryseolinea sp. T2]|uniref:glycosyltransferase family 4 protein n=1 Tax=Chryseolinea sp. T2 TaxID=3129255 RepID=UPI003076C59A